MRWGLLGSDLTEVDGELAGLSYGLDSFIEHWGLSDSTLDTYGDSKFALSKIEKDPIIAFKLAQIRSWGVPVNLSWIPRSENTIANDLAKKIRSNF